MFDLSTKTILVVDDEPALLNVLDLSLSQIGLEVILAKDGVTAIEQFKAQRDAIDGVILDLNMPRKSGREVFRELRDMKPDIPIWIFTGSDVKSANAEFEGDSATKVLGKPFSMSMLREELTNELR